MTQELTGTTNKDILIGTSESENILGQENDDILSGKDGNDTIDGGAGNDEIDGNGGNNQLIGGDGNDILNGARIRTLEAGNNLLDGGAGDDVLISDNGNDVLNGGEGSDIFGSGEGNDFLKGGAGNDDLLNSGGGGAGDDRIFGDGGNDRLNGGDGQDQLFGGANNDILAGFEGNDRLAGDEGADTFVLASRIGRETILDYQDGQDKFVLGLGSALPGTAKLSFEQLEITQAGNGATIAIADTDEVLATVLNAQASSLTKEDFITDINMGQMAEAQTSAQTASFIPTQQKSAVNKTANANAIDNVGAVTSQGVKAMKADEARKTFGVDGSGITIGVISDSYDRSLTASTRASDGVASGDLPGEGNPNGYTTPVRVLDDSADNSFGSLIDEGRGMMEIIHDVAPGAELLFHTGFKNSENFAQGIKELAAAGADIIVDDVFYLGEEPFFQDGVIAQAVDEVVNNGVAYFALAGNLNRDSYASEFRGVEIDENAPIAGIDRERYLFHDFNRDAAVDLEQSITLAPGESIRLSLNWDEPFASAGGKGAGSDLDVFVLDSQNNLVSTSTESNAGKNAVEEVLFANTTQQNAQYNLLIGFDRSAGETPPSQLKYISFGSGPDVEYATNSSTTFGHANSDRGATVGATNYNKTPAFGTDPAQIEAFSSLGGTPILFTPNGDRLGSPEIRQNPKIVAPNGANTSFFGGEDIEQDGFPNFSGTSAAAPHAAGVAALTIDAAPGSSPDKIYDTLEQTALDMDDPATSGFDKGFDFASGNGLIQADRALEALVGSDASVA